MRQKNAKLFTIIIPALMTLFFLVGTTAALAQPVGVEPDTDGAGNYLIETWQNLYWVSQNSGKWGADFKQTADIDFADADPAINTWDDDKGWTPIGNWGAAFTGTYDGGGHTISGLFINRPDWSEGYGQGLFGYTDTESEIKNLGVINVNIIAYDYVGGLVGSNAGTVTNSYATGTMTGRNHVGGLVGRNSGTVTNSYATGDVEGNWYVGGLVGWNWDGTVTNSFATGVVTGQEYHAGGLVGRNEGTVTNSYATGDVEGPWYVGGLVGSNTGTVTNSYATGTVSGTEHVGGLVGRNEGTVTNSFWDTQTGGPDNGIGTGKNTAEMKDIDTFTTDLGENRWDFTNTWVMSSENTFGGYPTLQWTHAYADEPDQVGGFYEIETLSHLVWIAADSDRWSYNYRQIADIDASITSDWDGGKGWTPIGNLGTAFTGTYDGDGHTISGLRINRPDGDGSRQGLFGKTGADAEVRNLGMKNVVITGINWVGGLVGDNRGKVTNSWAKGKVEGHFSDPNTGRDVGGLVGLNSGTVSNSWADVTVKGDNRLGGLVGRNLISIDDDQIGRIENSYAIGDVEGDADGQEDSYVGGLVGINDGTVTDSYATGNVSGTGKHVGGLVGKNREPVIGPIGHVQNSYATGDVQGASHVGGLVGDNDKNTIKNSYSTGAVTGDTNVGGLVGRNDGTVTNSFWDTETSGQTTSAGGTGAIGKTSAQMRQFATFDDAGWDIEETTSTYTGQPYPGLRMEAGKVWQIMASYAVTYDANQATEGTPPDPQVKFHGEDLTLATNSGGLARTGYTFAGWNTAADGSGTNYAEGATYDTDAALTLFAKWEGITEKTVETATGEGNATVKISAAHAAAGHVFTSVTAQVPPAGGPDNVEFPYGFFSFTITGLAADGDCSTVILEFPRNTAINTYYKYGRTQANQTKHWYEFLYDGQTGAIIQHTANHTEITLHLCDGQRGDSDLLANSVIDDPGGPGIRAAPSPGPGPGPGPTPPPPPPAIWDTEIGLVNPGEAGATGVLRGFDGDGTQVWSRSVALRGHGRLELNLRTVAGSLASRIKTARLDITGGEMVGYQKFYRAGTYRAGIEALPRANEHGLFVPHIASNEDWWTGIGLHNTTAESKTLLYQFDTADQRQVDITAGGHRAFTVASMFDNVKQPQVGSARVMGGEGNVGLVLFGNEQQLGGVSLSDALTTELVFSHVAHNQQWWTGIVVYNPGQETADITLEYRDAQGNLLESGSAQVEPGRRHVGTPESLGFPGGVEWFAVQSSQPVTGFVLFGTTNSQQLGGHSVVDPAAASGIFPKLERDGWTGIALVNASGEAAEVLLEARNNMGTLIAGNAVALGPGQKLVGMAETLFPGQDISQATYIRYTSSQPLTAFQLNGSTDGTLLDGLPALGATHVGTTTLYFPHIAVE